MPIQHQLFQLGTGEVNVVGLKRDRSENETAPAQEKPVSPCKKLKASPTEQVFEQPELLKQFFSLLDPPSQLRLNSCSKSIGNVQFGDNKPLMDVGALREVAARFNQQFGFPFIENIHSDPVEAAKIIFRELKIDRYINRYLKPMDHVTFAQKLAYMTRGQAMPAIATDNLHETNRQLDHLRAVERNTPIPRQIGAYLDAVENRLAAGQRERAWVQANLAFANCTDDRASDIRAIYSASHGFETKALVLLCYLKSPIGTLRIHAAHKLVCLVKRAPQAGAMLLQVEGLLDSVTQLLFGQNNVHCACSMRIIHSLVSSEANAVRLGRYPRLLDGLIQGLRSSDDRVRQHASVVLSGLIKHLPDNSTLFNCTGLLEGLHHVFSQPGNSSQTAAAKAVGWIVERPHGRDLLEEYLGLVDDMIPLLMAEKLSKQLAAIFALTRLARAMPDKLQLMNLSGLMEAIRRLSTSSNKQLRTLVATLLEDFSNAIDNQILISQSPGGDSTKMSIERQQPSSASGGRSRNG